MSHQGHPTVNRHNALPAVPQRQFPSVDMQADDIFLDFKMSHAGEDDVWRGMTDATWDRMSVGELFDAAEEKICLV